MIPRVFDPHAKPLSTLPSPRKEEGVPQSKTKLTPALPSRISSIPAKRDTIPSRDSTFNNTIPHESSPLPIQRQSMPVSRQSTSTSIKPRTSIFARKSDVGINERKEESAQKRVEELARENARLHHELDKAHVSYN